MLVLLLLLLLLGVGNAGPRLQVLDRSGYRQASTASAGSQWAPPDLNCKGWIAVGTAGPQPPAIDRRGHRQTSTASARSQWAPLCLNRQGTAGPRPPVLDVAVGTAGPRQIECLNLCQIEGQNIWSVRMYAR